MTDRAKVGFSNSVDEKVTLSDFAKTVSDTYRQLVSYCFLIYTFLQLHKYCVCLYGPLKTRYANRMRVFYEI